jgi:hypothetical protein
MHHNAVQLSFWLADSIPSVVACTTTARQLSRVHVCMQQGLYVSSNIMMMRSGFICNGYDYQKLDCIRLLIRLLVRSMVVVN